MIRRSLLVAAMLAAGCADEPDPCADVVCDEGFVCVTGAGGAVCAPPVDVCHANACAAGETCVVGADGLAKCLTTDRCRGVQCPLGKGCDPATGECTLDKEPCDGVFCPAGQVCDPATGECVVPEDLCSNVCCGSNQVCDPQTGSCVADQCADPAVECLCGPAQVCDPLTGDCLDRPGDPCEGCGPDQFCDERRRTCVTIEPGLPADGEVGSACARSADCTLAGANGFCIVDDGLFGNMPGGSCSASCDTRGCPSGSGCVDVGLMVCLDLCLSKSDCREGYDCLSITSDDPRTFCFPAGSGGSRCTGPECARIGDGCAEDNDCVSGARCANMPGGYCLKNNCRPVDCDETKENCLCLNTGDCAGSTIGLGKCNLFDQDCRPGYACLPLRSDTSHPDGYCYPRTCETDSDCRVEGDSCSTAYCNVSRGLCEAPCTEDSDCYGGGLCDLSEGRCYQYCRTELDNCGPDGFCNTARQACERRCRGDATCDANEFCDSTTGRCTPRCQGDLDCPAGNFCDAQGRCRPECDSDEACSGSEYCEAGRCRAKCTPLTGCSFGQFCDTSSGRCRRDLSATQVGRSCGADSECGPYNATCLQPPAYPGGYCSSLGCSALEPCGAGAACVGSGSEAKCAKTCVPGEPGTCRQGYSCRLESGQNVCVPD